MTRRLGVAVIGHSFMGRAHSHAWRTAPRAFQLPLEPEMRVLVGRDPERAAQAAAQLGWLSSDTDVDAVLARDDIDVVDICTPGGSHADLAIRALEAGKHVLVEKPMANSLAEAEAMVAAASRAAGAFGMVGYTYRRVPAVEEARRIIAAGTLGSIRHVRVRYLQDWLIDPEFPLTWRLQREIAGSGALGDLGAHAIDLAQHVTGAAFEGISAQLETFVRERPLAAASDGLAATAGTERSAVTVDDAAAFTGRLRGGALATVEVSRMATGRKNALQLEIDGERGSLAWDVERLGELQVLDATEPATRAGSRRVLVTEAEHPWMSAWWPPGHMLGWEHAFVHQVHDFAVAIAAGVQPRASFADGLAVQRVLDAVERSAADASRWTPVA